MGVLFPTSGCLCRKEGPDWQSLPGLGCPTGQFSRQGCKARPGVPTLLFSTGQQGARPRSKEEIGAEQHGDSGRGVGVVLW